MDKMSILEISENTHLVAKYIFNYIPVYVKKNNIL